MSQFTKELPTVPIVPVWWFFFPFNLHKYKKIVYMDENSCVLLPLTTQLKKAVYLECVLCPGTASPSPAKWWQYLKPSSKVMLQNKHWCKSCGKDPALASWVIFCEFTHHLLSETSYCHSWGQDLGLSTVERLSPCLWVLQPLVRLEGMCSCPLLLSLVWKQRAVSRLPWKETPCPAVSSSPCSPLHQGWTHPLQRSMQGFTALISPQPVHTEPLQVCQGNNNSNLSILVYVSHIPVHFFSCCVDLTLGF